jgi:hypothetical protein
VANRATYNAADFYRDRHPAQHLINLLLRRIFALVLPVLSKAYKSVGRQTYDQHKTWA